MTVFYKKVCAIVKQRGGIVGPLQLWQVVDDKIVMWSPKLGTKPTSEEIDAIQLEIDAELLTAEQVVSKYFSAYQIAALQRLEMSLIQANKPLGPIMIAAKNWLESVMLEWAIDPTPKPQAAFGSLPNGVTFESASAEAVAMILPVAQNIQSQLTKFEVKESAE